jgi:hypothetical protein
LTELSNCKTEAKREDATRSDGPASGYQGGLGSSEEARNRIMASDARLTMGYYL